MNSAQNKTSSQELDPITSPAIKANDLIANLARYELLDPLLKAQAESEYINTYPIGEEFKSLSTQEAGNYLVKQLNIQSQEELNTWRQAHGFFKEDDVITYAQHLHKKHAVINDLLSGSSELSSCAIKTVSIASSIAWSGSTQKISPTLCTTPSKLGNSNLEMQRRNTALVQNPKRKGSLACRLNNPSPRNLGPTSHRNTTPTFPTISSRAMACNYPT